MNARPLLWLLLSTPACAAALDLSKLPPAAEGQMDFARDIRPIFETHCVKCHGPEKQKGGWRADVRDEALKGGDTFAPNIHPGKGAESPLIHFVSGLDEEMVMPQKGEKLTTAEIGKLRAWIDQGAPWPDDGVKVVDAKTTHWSFQPVQRPPLPDEQNPIDGFIRAKLAEQGLNLSPEADRRTLIRRLSFDLLGLPPSPQEIEAFIADPDPRAYEKLVERLLASPRYGERWARHWLDVVRFAESHGFEKNRPRDRAWPFRDYVIRAFNEDKPYDQFIREQLAGDALNADAATGFLVAGPYDEVKSPDPVLTAQQRADELHDIVSTTGSTFLGLTVGCARCHNHKFDPISQVDYYALTALLQGVKHGERPLLPPDAKERQTKAGALRRELQPIEAKLASYQPTAQPLRVLVVDDHSAPTGEGPRPGVTQIEQPANGQPIAYSPGRERGQAEDPGDTMRLPNLGESYRYWSPTTVPKTDVFSWDPKAAGRFRIWLSWGVWPTHTQDARYVLDLDGDPQTTGDQTELASIDQRKFADGASAISQQKRWSGLKDAGIHELRVESRVLLRTGEKSGPMTADTLVFEEVRAKFEAHAPHLRAPVSHRANEEWFAPVEAKFIRFTILASTSAEPCIDELEVFTAAPNSRNVARASAGARAQSSGDYGGGNNPKHRLPHLIDGKYGNSHSWISNARNTSWAQVELAQPTSINRIVWSRDRGEAPEKIYDDRLPTDYRIEVSLDGEHWQEVASSVDRLAVEYRKKVSTIPTLGRIPADRAAEVEQLVAQRKLLLDEVKTLTTFTQAYLGRFEPPGPTHRLHRGDPMQKKEEVHPAALAEFRGQLDLPADAPEQQRRLALADWIVNPQNPLTARVMVNRIWHYHFGTGLVDTPSDFGLNGTKPTHPELLDWLASEFIARGWRMKEIHRLILLSATYRQASTPSSKAMAVDAQNRLLWRFPPRRLEAEPLRDTMLAVSGKLDLRMGGPGFDLFEPNDNYVKVYVTKQEYGPEEFRRMVYQNKPRVQLDDIFGAFDCPDAGQIAPRRTSSTTPLQALNLLNSPFALQQAQLSAERLAKEAGDEPAAQVSLAFRLAFGRAPAEEELTVSTQLIRQHGLTVFCRALFNANEFIHVY